MSKEIQLTKDYHALVDDADFEELNKYKWYYFAHRRTAYAYRKEYGTQKTIYMHRQIMSAIKGDVIDHINSNGLDNRRSNLRLVTHSQNQQNRRPAINAVSKYKGVWLNKNSNLWIAEICVQGTHKLLGSYCTQREAATAYNQAATHYFGEYANLNIISDEPDPQDKPLRTKKVHSCHFRGVDLHRQTGKWRARLHVNYKEIHLGLYDTQELAARAYDQAARHYQGKKAKLNFPDSG